MKAASNLHLVKKSGAVTDIPQPGRWMDLSVLYGALAAMTVASAQIRLWLRLAQCMVASGSSLPIPTVWH